MSDTRVTFTRVWGGRNLLKLLQEVTQHAHTCAGDDCVKMAGTATRNLRIKVIPRKPPTV